MLNLIENKIKSLKGFENLVNLKLIVLTSNLIQRVDELKYLENLNELYLELNQIKSLNGLENLKKLQWKDIETRFPILNYTVSHCQ